jgi:hypothetical protein
MLGSVEEGPKNLSHHDCRCAAVRAAEAYLTTSELEGPDEHEPLRTLEVTTPFFKRYNRRQPVFQLDFKPEVLGTGALRQRAWQTYQSYLGRVRVIARADFYARLMERYRLKSVRALARLTGEDWSRIARILRPARSFSLGW